MMEALATQCRLAVLDSLSSEERDMYTDLCATYVAKTDDKKPKQTEDNKNEDKTASAAPAKFDFFQHAATLATKDDWHNYLLQLLAMGRYEAPERNAGETTDAHRMRVVTVMHRAMIMGRCVTPVIRDRMCAAFITDESSRQSFLENLRQADAAAKTAEIERAKQQNSNVLLHQCLAPGVNVMVKLAP
jgi:hypothetical protein